MKPTVFVVDDDPAICDALTRLLTANRLPVRAYASAEAFLADVGSGQPGCLVLDVNLPGMSGPELQAQLGARGVYLPVVFLTGHADVRTSVQVLKAGALDLLEKPVNSRELLDRVRDALGANARQREKEAAVQAIRERYGRLTAREQEVMALLVRGCSGREIARRLRISPRTVEVHRARVLQKMEAGTVLELARLAEACELGTDGTNQGIINR